MNALVLGGGPDAEREVSLESSDAVARALESQGLDVNYQIIDRPGPGELRAMPGEIVFPALHGLWGEGGPLQDLLEADGRAYVGSRPLAARQAMDKLASKLVALECGAQTARAGVFDLRDEAAPIEPPLVLKPVRDGSSVGVHLVRTVEQWASVRAAAKADIEATPGRAYMVERLVDGRELTVPLLDLGEGLCALDIIEIAPAEGFYDFQAKYQRDDTSYLVGPELPEGVAQLVRRQAERIAGALGVRHLARADFLLDRAGTAWFLEINTMPGFTGHSLVPMAAERAGLGFGALCSHLVKLAAGDRQS